MRGVTLSLIARRSGDLQTTVFEYDEDSFVRKVEAKRSELAAARDDGVLELAVDAIGGSDDGDGSTCTRRTDDMTVVRGHRESRGTTQLSIGGLFRGPKDDKWSW